MENTELKAQKELYKTHLEFLGYSIEEDPTDEQAITARSQDAKWYFAIFNKGVRILQVWSISEHVRDSSNRLVLLEFINDANLQHTAQYSITKSGNVCIQMTALCPYERVAFGTFFEFFNKEVSSIGKLPNAGKIFGF